MILIIQFHHLFHDWIGEFSKMKLKYQMLTVTLLTMLTKIGPYPSGDYLLRIGIYCTEMLHQ